MNLPHAADGPGDRPPRLRFPKAARLFRSAEFARVRGEGAVFHGRSIVLGVLRDAESGPARAGIITSKRVGGAVSRSLARRRIREIIRLARPRLLAGTWIVIIAKPGAAKAELAVLQREWTSLAERAGILNTGRNPN